MSNGNLGCAATNCVHNNASNCYAGGITVAGSGATSTSSTACVSFQDRSTSGMTNSSSEGCDCTKPNSIVCQAGNCKYNDNQACKAPSVQINAQNATCETFVIK